jgi:hypothetical protein
VQIADAEAVVEAAVRREAAVGIQRSRFVDWTAAGQSCRCRVDHLACHWTGLHRGLLGEV